MNKQEFSKETLDYIDSLNTIHEEHSEWLTERLIKAERIIGRLFDYAVASQQKGLADLIFNDHYLPQMKERENRLNN